ncbi:MAG TPA: hypothetical protein VEN31_06025 [Candidatus Bathyarchaeia archaeon]|nr:hypothetical protein [Candidatus Bathyarchaeia archaeon]
MRRSLFVALGVAIAFVLGGQTAYGAAPMRIVQLPVHDTIPAGAVCPFAVAVDSVTINEKATVWSGGRVILTGNSVERITNLATGKSVVVNVSGPFTLTSAGGVDTFMATGRNLFGLRSGDLGPGQPGALLLTTGLVIFTQSPSGVTFTHVGGTTENLCQTLS